MKNAKRKTIVQIRKEHAEEIAAIRSKQIPEYEIREVIHEVTRLRNEVTILRAQVRVLDIIEAAQRSAENPNSRCIGVDAVEMIRMRLSGNTPRSSFESTSVASL